MKHLGRTTWEFGEPFKNMMGTRWEQGKKKILPQDQGLVATMLLLHHLFLATFYLVKNFKILT
jgi:hypothetical protein